MNSVSSLHVHLTHECPAGTSKALTVGEPGRWEALTGAPCLMNALLPTASLSTSGHVPLPLPPIGHGTCRCTLPTTTECWSSGGCQGANRQWQAGSSATTGQQSIIACLICSAVHLLSCAHSGPLSLARATPTWQNSERMRLIKLLLNIVLPIFSKCLSSHLLGRPVSNLIVLAHCMASLSSCMLHMPHYS